MSTTDASVFAALITRAFTVSIETVGLARFKVAQAIKSAVGGRCDKDEEACAYVVTAEDGRVWRVLDEVALTGMSGKGGEIISPVLHYGDMATLEAVVGAVGAAGATVDSSCGLRVMVDGRDMTVASVARLVTDVENHEGMLDRALGIPEGRRAHWCKALPTALTAEIRELAAVSGMEPARTMASLEVAYATHAGEGDVTNPWSPGMAYGLNLYSLFYRGAVEFNQFTATLAPEVLRAYVTLALGFMARATTAKTVQPGKGWALYSEATKLGCLRTFFTHHGIVGDSFATVRVTLTARMARKPEVAATAV